MERMTLLPLKSDEWWSHLPREGTLHEEHVGERYTCNFGYFGGQVIFETYRWRSGIIDGWMDESGMNEGWMSLELKEVF